jgi:hypothetical protein
VLLSQVEEEFSTWKTVNSTVRNAADFESEIMKLTDEVETVFLDMFAECVKREESAKGSRKELA